MFNLKEQIWEIKMTELDYIDCYASHLISYAEMMKIDYAPAFLGYWGLRDSEISDNIATERFRELLKKYCCLTLSKYSLENSIELFEFISKHLCESPIILQINEYNCPWSSRYKKYNFNGYIMIIGIVNKGLVCLDYHVKNEKRLILPKKDLKNWSGDVEIIYHEKKNSTSITSKDFIVELQRAYNDIENTNMINRLRNFANIISSSNYFNYFNKYNKNIEMIPILIQLKKISDDREAFLVALDKYNSLVLNNFTTLISVIREAIKGINITKNEIIKQLLKEEIDLEYVNKSFGRVIEIEKENVILFRKILAKGEDLW